MKKNIVSLFLLFLLLFSSYFFLPKKEADLSSFSFHFFRKLFEKEEIRRVFSLEEEEAIAVFYQEENPYFV